MLSKFEPVGIMVYGAAEFIPQAEEHWNTVLARWESPDFASYRRVVAKGAGNKTKVCAMGVSNKTVLARNYCDDPTA